MKKERVEVKVREKIATVQMKRENKLNALNFDLIGALQETFIALEKDSSVHGIILTGTGKSFIVGADIDIMKNLDTRSGVEFITALHGLLGTIRHLSKPVVASINGYCFGAGLELAISCDLSIASEEARFGMQEVKLGIPSVIEAALLPFVIGLNRTRELLLTGEVIDAEAAGKMGLVNHVVEHEKLPEASMEYARRIADNAPHAVALQKQLINRWLEHAGMEASIKSGIDHFGLAFGHEETRKRMGKALK